jgi:hypothetical protein
MCVTSKPARCNTTVVGLCRRLLEDAELANIHVTWVKVRGHSGNYGNDMADRAATQGMNGDTEYVMEVAQYVNHLLGRATWRPARPTRRTTRVRWTPSALRRPRPGWRAAGVTAAPGDDDRQSAATTRHRRAKPTSCGGRRRLTLAAPAAAGYSDGCCIRLHEHGAIPARLNYVARRA